jgi:hypothetical protein
VNRLLQPLFFNSPWDTIFPARPASSCSAAPRCTARQSPLPASGEADLVRRHARCGAAIEQQRNSRSFSYSKSSTIRPAARRRSNCWGMDRTSSSVFALASASRASSYAGMRSRVVFWRGRHEAVGRLSPSRVFAPRSGQHDGCAGITHGLPRRWPARTVGVAFGDALL